MANKDPIFTSLVLKDAELLKAACYIDGRWLRAENDATLTVRNPATGLVIGTVPDMGAV